MALLCISLLFLLYVSSVYSETRSHIVYLGNSNPSVHPDEITSSHYTLLTNALGSSEAAEEALIYTYKHGFNGFAAKLTDEQVARISRLPNVVSVFPNGAKKLHTTESWDFLGLTDHTDRTGLTSTLSNNKKPTSIWKDANYGDNIVIGSLDSGVWPESESYLDHGMSKPPKKWKGSCQDGQNFTASLCNRKLIGANYFHKGYDAENGAGYIQQKGDFLSARDSGGHGTHTSSTAAGRFVKNANLFGYANGTAKGGAPLARLAMYKVCWPTDPTGGECYDADILAAIDKGIHDGVDVFTLSLGSSPPLPPFFQDAIAIGAYHAMQRGIVVVCSAGNSGPDAGSVGNVSPWIITVAASSLDRSFTSHVVLGNNQTFKGQTLSQHALKHKTYPLVASRDVPAPSSNSTASELCFLGSLDPKKVKGKIVACLRGVNARVEKGAAVFQAGGAGMILCNAEANGNEIVADAHFLPALQINAQSGSNVFQYINSTRHPTAYISPGTTQLNVKPAPTMASFSSAGPNSLVPDILKPDTTAPGLNILAAFTEVSAPSDIPLDKRRVKFNVLSGTSMSCPHVAGIVALLKAYHPDWSPAAIRSAIVTSGYQLNNVKRHIQDSSSEEATPFAFGGGHINPNGAAHPGLIYDTTEKDYIEFLCRLRYDESAISILTGTKVTCPRTPKPVYQLNQPSIVFHLRRENVTVERTVTNVGGHRATYRVTVSEPEGVKVSVSPEVLRFKHKGERLTYKVTFSPDLYAHRYVFGHITWTDGRHSVRSPIAVNTR